MSLQSDLGSFPCSLATRKSDEDIIASTGNIRAQLSIELPEPWEGIPAKSSFYPVGLNEATNAFLKLKIGIGINFFAPDPSHSKPDYTRVFLFKKSSDTLAPFEKHEYLFHNSVLNSSLLIMAQSFDNLSGAPLEGKVESAFENEIFVCGHESRDACCGKLGMPVFRKLKELTEQSADQKYRVWKTSHIGGHKYAPTLFEAPSMRWWGLLTEDLCESFLNREKGQFSLGKQYRGWAALDNPFAQVAEREILNKVGWSWLKAHNVICDTEIHSSLTKADVKFHFSNANAENKFNTFSACVEFSRTLSSIASCNATSEKTVKQYFVSDSTFAHQK